MANFNTHLNVAFMVSGTLSLTVYKAGLVDDSGFLMCAALGTIGGLLPDLDSDNSTPIKLGFNLISFVFAFGLVMHWRGELSLLALMVLWLAGYGFMRYVVFYVFTTMTVHRGVIHSVPYMAILGLALTYLSHDILHLPLTVSWFYGLFLFGGAMVHLALDELYSVNLSNMKMKRSSGTAMKFYQHKDKWWYLLLYVILVLLLYIAPPFDTFWQQVSDPAAWAKLKLGLWPELIKGWLS
ncbi:MULTISPECIES: metal-dependent hydrolase [unclassified Psychrobacter]|uniref:metal-dependent hydrolase n=1 Tax=unclassified Psychrobacter TaxID=196806 RepID=UPI000946FA4B|nr:MULTISPECIES: metal-dependent hydrolase [unclassified Psychrobacter]OLF39926.1 hydrolase [Psychrobacter sp. Rd 27.2]PJX20599.1 hydrolase [Psychrobacter sp. L7]